MVAIEQFCSVYNWLSNFIKGCLFSIQSPRKAPLQPFFSSDITAWKKRQDITMLSGCHLWSICCFNKEARIEYDMLYKRRKKGNQHRPTCLEGKEVLFKHQPNLKISWTNFRGFFFGVCILPQSQIPSETQRKASTQQKNFANSRVRICETRPHCFIFPHRRRGQKSQQKADSVSQSQAIS